MQKLNLFLTMVAAGLLAISNTGCSARAKAVYHAQRANRYFNSGQYDRAEVEYINVLRNDPQNAGACGRLGIIYFDEGRYQSAAPFLYKGVQLATNNPELRVKLGFIYLAMGKSKEAGDEAGLALARNPRDKEAPILLAESARTPAAITAARQRLQSLPQGGDPATVETALGILAFQAHDFRAAADAFQHAKTLDPKSDDAYAASAALHWAQNELPAAEADFKAAAALSPARSPHKLQYAQFEIQTSNAPVAKNILGAMAKAAPDYIPAWVGLAEIALDENRLDDCATALNKVLVRDPDNYAAELLSGRLDLARGDTAKAIGELERLAGDYPQVAQVHYQLAVAYLANGDQVKGVNSLNTAVSLEPGLSQAVLLLAQLEIKNGDPASAVVALEQLLAGQPALLPAQLLLADAFRAQDKFDTARAIYNQLANSHPQNPQFLLLLGSTLLQQNDNDGARKEFTRAWELAPNSLPALEELVDLDLSEKQYSAAMQLLETAIVKSPKQAAAYLLEAKVFEAQGERPQAEAALLQVIELQPEYQSAYLLLAQLYFDSKQDQKAGAALDTAMKINAKNIPALMLLAAVRNDEKNYQAAADTYEQLLQIDPNSAPAINNLACLYADQLNQLDRAYQLARRAQNLLPDDPSTADTLGWILCKRGEYSPALNLLQGSASRLADEPDAQFHLGMTCYLMGKEELARAAFQRALQSNQEFPNRAECSECLAVLAVDAQAAGPAAQAVLEKRIDESPNDPVALGRLAAIYQREGISDKAAQAFETILKTDPQNVGALTNLAQLDTAQFPPKAFGLAKAAYNLAPNDPGTVYVFGRLAFLNGNYPLAAGVLQEAVQAQPANPMVLHDFAEAAYSIGKVPEARAAMLGALQAGLTAPQSDEARQFLDLMTLAANPAQAAAAEPRMAALLKSNPQLVPALMVMAAIDESKSNSLAAEQVYEAVLGRYPDFVPAQRSLAILYAADSGDPGRAYTLAIKARESFPNDPELGKALGIITFRQGDYAHAASLLKESAAERSADAELLYYLGDSQYRLNDRVESKASLQRALSMNLPQKLAVSARQILTEMN